MRALILTAFAALLVGCGQEVGGSSDKPAPDPDTETFYNSYGSLEEALREDKAKGICYTAVDRFGMSRRQATWRPVARNCHDMRAFDAREDG